MKRHESTAYTCSVDTDVQQRKSATLLNNIERNVHYLLNSANDILKINILKELVVS